MPHASFSICEKRVRLAVSIAWLGSCVAMGSKQCTAIVHQGTSEGTHRSLPPIRCSEASPSNDPTKPTLGRELVLDAVLMAVRQRHPKNALIHSDQGSQYSSDAWWRFCRDHHLRPSMSRRGNCWDNAVAESFFSSLKKERIKKRIYRTRDIANAEIFEYIESFYNRTRRHSHLRGVSLEAYEAASRRVSRCPE